MLGTRENVRNVSHSGYKFHIQHQNIECSLFFQSIGKTLSFKILTPFSDSTRFIKFYK